MAIDKPKEGSAVRVRLPMMAAYKGKLRPKKGTFFRPQVYERVGILLVEVYKRGVKSVLWVFEKA